MPAERDACPSPPPVRTRPREPGSPVPASGAEPAPGGGGPTPPQPPCRKAATRKPTGGPACPSCHATRSRYLGKVQCPAHPGAVRRVRQCLGCHRRFRTTERAD